MRIIWKENHTLPDVWYIATPKNIPMASNNKELTIQEYDKKRLDRPGITVEKSFEKEISRIRYCMYILRGFSQEQILKKEFNAKYPFDIEIQNE